MSGKSLFDFRGETSYITKNPIHCKWRNMAKPSLSVSLRHGKVSHVFFSLEDDVNSFFSHIYRGCKLLTIIPKPELVGGWTNPLKKYARQIGSFPQVGMKIRNIRNHHLLHACFVGDSLIRSPTGGVLVDEKITKTTSTEPRLFLEKPRSCEGSSVSTLNW